MKHKWFTIGKKKPSIGMSIEVRYFDDEPGLWKLPSHKWVKLLRVGKISTVTDIGGRYISIDTNKYVGMALRSDYQWRLSA